jgi:tetratricopeptide (TPR) repeat protein
VERATAVRPAFEPHDAVRDIVERLDWDLAVFAGSFDLDAATAVCDADLDRVASLVDTSLLTYDGERFAMLETIREYALEQLEARPGSDRVRARHVEYVAERARRIDAQVRGPMALELLDRLEQDHDNLRAALGRLLREDPERALQLALDVEVFWTLRGRIAEGSRWLARVLDATSGATALRAHALRELASFAEMRGRVDEQRALSERALEAALASGDEREVAGALLGVERYDDALAAYTAIGDDRGIAGVRYSVAAHALADGDVARAQRLFEDALAIYRRLQLPWAVAGTLVELGDCALASGDSDGAVALYHESIAIACDLRSDPLVAEGVGALAAATAARGDSERAALLWGAVEHAERVYGMRLATRSRREPHVATALTANAEAREQGRRLDLAAALAVATAPVD